MMDLIGKYGIFGIIKLSVDILLTKMQFPRARLIRRPFDIRGKKHISISKGFTTGRGCRLEAYPLDKKGKVLFLGENIEINDYVHITAMESVIIRDNVLIASKVYISDCSHGSYVGDQLDSSPLTIPKERPFLTKKVVIEENVWIGEGVSILPGVTIGKGSIIGANSVVSKNIPSNTIAVGSPARPIKEYNFELKRWERVI